MLDRPRWREVCHRKCGRRVLDHGKRVTGTSCTSVFATIFWVVSPSISSTLRCLDLCSCGIAWSSPVGTGASQCRTRSSDAPAACPFVGLPVSPRQRSNSIPSSCVLLLEDAHVTPALAGKLAYHRATTFLSSATGFTQTQHHCNGRSKVCAGSVCCVIVIVIAIGYWLSNFSFALSPSP